MWEVQSIALNLGGGWILSHPNLGSVVCQSRKCRGNTSFWHLLFNMSLQQQYPESFYIIREVALIFGLSNQKTEYKSTKSTKIQNRKVQKYKNAKMLIFQKCKKCIQKYKIKNKIGCHPLVQKCKIEKMQKAKKYKKSKNKKAKKYHLYISY